MSQIATSAVREKELVMIHSPMQLESPRDLNALRPGRTSPDQQPHQHQQRASMPRSQAPPELNTRSRLDEPKINTNGATSTKAESYGEDQLCVCTPAQHVPRPCNSFILYRTRMAAQATAENPALSNPQISKILGDRWAKESDEVKARWKKLAEEESRRHRQQYPGYRFQPKRRGSKASQAKTPDDEPERCPRCNGLKVLRTPNPATPVRRKSDPDASAHSGRGLVRRSSDAGETSPISPDPKRRRLTHAADTPIMAPLQIWSRDPPRHHQQQGYPGMTTPISTGPDEHGRAYTHVGTPLPGPGAMAATPRHGSMPPPPRPPVPGTWSSPGYGYPSHRGQPDDSVRLPPLKTAITPAVSSAPSMDSGFGYTPLTSVTPGMAMSGSSRGSPEKSTTEQIMSISITRKMAVVSKICPPLRREGRGAIISVEGTQPESLAQVSDVVERALASCRDVNLRTLRNDSRFGRGSGVDPEGSTELHDLMPSIFQDILGWHDKSKDVAHFVRSRGGSAADGSSPTDARARTPGSMPVALLRDGFSLTMSDRFACATSHSLNNYGPVDHWQWMATLWRGIVGPDMIVYAKPCPEDEMERLKTVEFQKQLGVMVVRIAAGKGLDEATERRLNFEIREWVTDVWPKESMARS